jgi:hypothetical protein
MNLREMGIEDERDRLCMQRWGGKEAWSNDYTRIQMTPVVFHQKP